MTGIIGYSMGGFGVVNLLGGGFTQASIDFAFSPLNGTLAQRTAGKENYPDEADPRIKAAIAIGSWGMNTGFWDAEGLAGIETPIFFMAGSADDVSGYENGTKAIFEAAVNAERYLLTFKDANHNAAAPIPRPERCGKTTPSVTTPTPCGTPSG
jgi:predicted dienelactone hydrolase